MALLVIKNVDGDVHPRAMEIANCVPKLELLLRASLVLYSTETRFFTFVTRNQITNEMEFSEVRATRSVQSLNLP